MDLRLNIPAKWIDLSPYQLWFVSLLFLCGITETEFLVKAFMNLSGLRVVRPLKPDRNGARWYKHRLLKKPVLIAPDLFVQMAESCRFLLKPDEIIPLPWLRMARARHYRLYNASLEEYLMAENYYFAYVETKKQQHLDNLISVLYRRPWHRWNASKIQKRAAIFSSLDAVTKNTVFMWYIGFRTYVPRRCRSLFSGKRSSRAFNPRSYINGMIHQLTNGDITLKKELLKQPVWNALDELEQRALEVESIKR